MCGIYGIFNKDDFKYINEFWDFKNRGPDFSAIHSYPKSIIGFHRLSIVDKTLRSNQPLIFFHENKCIVFICNGEIYNYKNLQQNHSLRLDSKSDCAVIPELYIKNDRCLEEWLDLFKCEIRGEFSFILMEYNQGVSNSLKRVIIARDQIGIRPLYSTKIDPLLNEYFCVSSELKGLISCEIDVQEYEPGIITVVDFKEKEKDFSVYRYDFKWVYNVEEIIMPDDYYLKRISDSIIDSVKLRICDSDPENISFLLSGGVDSSLIAAISSKLLKRQIHTYCCGFKDSPDLEYARIVSKYIDSVHHEVIFTETEAIALIRETIYAVETWDTTTIRASVGQFIVSKYIKENSKSKIILVGEGPDELCSSYLFNWYAPTQNSEISEISKKYVRNIHYYDGKRTEKCLAYNKLECRVPYLDPRVIQAYWEIPSKERHPKSRGIEKWWLRKAFEKMNLLPSEILWRKKEAFSDGISIPSNSWSSILEKYISNQVSDEELSNCSWGYHKPVTKEAYYYRKIFIQLFTEKRVPVIPGYWLPEWNSNGEKVTNYVDPSARLL